MVKNDYRRAFIMLRAALQGYGGHVRLERRTLTGSMYFIVTAPQGVGELSAALVGQQNGAYYAAPIGPLSRDRRGQLALAWQFDPRSIEGRSLEAYAWVAVVATGGPCALALVGNVEGSRPMEPEALARAVCARFAPEPTPAADLPEAGETEPTPEVEIQPVAEEDGGTPEAETQGDVKIYTLSRTRLRQRERRRVEAARAEQAQKNGDAVPENDAAPAEGEGNPYQPSVTAANRLGLDITRPWPGAAERLRRLFATQAPARTPLDDGYIYVAAPMPEGSGYGESLAGLRAENGEITGIRYALPARRTPEPPAGLEDYAWTPTAGEEGYWVTTVAVEQAP